MKGWGYGRGGGDNLKGPFAEKREPKESAYAKYADAAKGERPATEKEIDAEHAQDAADVANDLSERASDASARVEDNSDSAGHTAAQKAHEGAASEHRRAASRLLEVGRSGLANKHTVQAQLHDKYAKEHQEFQTGSRGGRFYLTATGQKVYIKK
jgi:L-lactate utilization protein LutC